jgi:hypothetical protein
MKASPPKLMAQNRHRIRSGNAALIRQEGATEPGADTEVGKVVPRNELCRGHLGFGSRDARSLHQHLFWPACGYQTRKNIVVVTGVGVLRRRKPILRFTTISVFEPSLQSNNLVRIGHRQGF